MNKKLAVITTSILFSLLSISTSYALDVLNDDEYAEYWYDPLFWDVSVSDNEFDIDVALVSAVISSDELLEVSIEKAYPGYEAYIEFTIKNIGDPVYITGLRNNTYDTTALSFDVFGITPGTLLGPDELITGILVITILDGALQNSFYDLDVFIDFGDTYPNKIFP